MELAVNLRSVKLADLESFTKTINSVCAEKWYVATTDGFSIERSRSFLKELIDNKFPELVAVDADNIIGWCHIIPNTKTGFQHVGRLGIGVRQDYRQKGIARKLLNNCLSRAIEYGLEKVELEVFSDNHAAIRLYDSFGFRTEGLKSKARKLEGRYQDIQLMALPLSNRIRSTQNVNSNDSCKNKER